MDSVTGAGAVGGGTRGRKKGKSRKGNGWSSRKRNSTSYCEAPPVSSASGGGGPHLYPAPAPPKKQQHRPSALQLLSQETKKRARATKASSTPLPAPSGNLLPKRGRPAPASVKLKRLQTKPVMAMETPKKTGGGRGRGPNSGPAGTRVIQARQNTVYSLDMPDLSQLSTSPIFAQIKEEMITPTPSPPPPLPLNKQGPFPFKRQGLHAYHHGSRVGGNGGDLLQVPVPVPHPSDVILSSYPNDFDFQSVFGTVVVPSSSGLSSKATTKQMSMNIDPNQMVCLEVPAESIQIAGKQEELSYQRMIRREEEEVKKKEQRRVMLGTSERLKNILKLPKAHKWVIYEWFYSDIDRVLFGGDNDFEICLRECFPNLKVRQMSRVEWCQIRAMMGKPRRSSVKFFEEEREQLAVRREKIRMIQRRKQLAEWGNLRSLPDEIPMMLTIGTSVTARVRKPQDGIFQGTVEGVDPSNNTYRIGFGRDGLGAHSIPDYEVRAQIPPETISTTSFCLKIPRQGTCNDAFKFKFRNAALLQENLAEGLPKSPFPIDSMLGGFPLRCLELIIRQSKLLKAKKSKLGELSELNVEAEKMRTYGKAYPEEYRKRYAICIVELEKINESLEKIMKVIQVYMEEIAEDAIEDGSGGRGGSSSSGKMVYPDKVKETADKQAKDIIYTYILNGGVAPASSKIMQLIQNLGSLMLQARALGTKNGERKAFELESIRDTLGNVKKSLEGESLMSFQNKVDIPLHRVMAGLCINPKVEEEEIKIQTT